MAQKFLKTDRCTNGFVGLAALDAINDNFEELYVLFSLSNPRLLKTDACRSGFSGLDGIDAINDNFTELWNNSAVAASEQKLLKGRRGTNGFTGLAALDAINDNFELMYIDGGSVQQVSTIEDFNNLTITDNMTIQFERGQVFELGDINITANNITLDAYGSGDDPILRGATSITGLTWSDEGDNVYSTTMINEPSWIWIGGVCAKNAETDRIAVSSRPNSTTVNFSHAAVSSFTNIVGSYIVVRDTPFSQSYRRTILTYNGAGSATVDGPINTNSNVDFVLLNDVEYFNALGNNQWAWRDGVLYLKVTVNPSTLDIRAGVYAFGIKTIGDMTVRNIQFREYYTSAIWSTSTALAAPNLDVQNCDFSDIRDVAVLIEREGTGTNISNNTYTRIGNNAVHTGPCVDSFFNNNIFTDIGMQVNYPWQTWNAGDGITALVGCAIAYTRDRYSGNTLLVELDGDNCEFNNNTITNVAYCGINVSIGKNNFIQRNVISDFLNRFEDGAGIYTFHYRPTNLFHENTEISDNIIFNDNASDNRAGIYIDNRSKAMYIHDNTVFDCGEGIRLNTDTSDHIIDSNIVLDCNYCYAFYQSDNGTLLTPLNIGNVFNNNLAVCYTSTQRCVWFNIGTGSYPTWNPYNTGGSADNNKYVATGTAIADSDNQGNNLTLAQLKTAYGEDANSLSRVESSRIFEYNTTNVTVGGNAGAGYEIFDGTDTDAYTIAPYSSIVLFPIPGVSYNSQSLQLVSANGQYVNFGTNADMQFDQTALWTITGIFKFTANPGATVTLFENRNDSLRGLCVQMLSSGAIQVQMVNTVTTNRIQYIDDADYADNQFHTIQVSKTGSGVASVIVKVDNVDVAPSINNNLTATILSTDNILIGVNTLQDAAAFCDMLTCQWAFWPTNQNPNSTLIYNNGITRNLMLLTSPPLHYWPLNGDLLDYGSSANPLNGTGIGTPVPTFSSDVP